VFLFILFLFSLNAIDMPEDSFLLFSHKLLLSEWNGKNNEERKK